jgi:hypothetical protein
MYSVLVEINGESGQVHKRKGEHGICGAREKGRGVPSRVLQRT